MAVDAADHRLEIANRIQRGESRRVRTTPIRTFGAFDTAEPDVAIADEATEAGDIADDRLRLVFA